MLWKWTHPNKSSGSVASPWDSSRDPTPCPTGSHFGVHARVSPSLPKSVPTTVAIQTGQLGVVILTRPTRSMAPPSQTTQVSTFDPCSGSGSPNSMVVLSSAPTADPEPSFVDLLTPMEICDREPSPPFPAAALAAPVSLLQLPDRPLTLQTPQHRPPSSDSSVPGSPYHRRFPTVMASPPDLSGGPCSPIGIWPSAASRKRSGTEWHETLLDPVPAASHHIMGISLFTHRGVRSSFSLHS